MTKIKFLSVALIACSFGNFSVGQVKTTALAEATQHAIEQSQLTLPGSEPFHLTASIVETTNPASEYKGEIEEYWVSPAKWRRTITSPGFSQTLVVNGDKTYEQDKGDYFPWWLNDLATAIFDPVPLSEQLKQVNAQMARPSGSGSTACSRIQGKIGTPPAENSVYLVLCFEGSHGLLDSIITPGYDASFKDYESFSGKRVARRVVIDPEPGTTIEAKVTNLSDLKSPDEAIFAIEQPTPSRERIKTVHLSDSNLRGLSLLTPDIVWPPVRSGKTDGVVSLYISVDREGYVRETWPLTADNGDAQDAAREQVMKWQFKPATSEGISVQVEAAITLAFSTKIGNPIRILTDEEARKLAIKVVEPIFPPGTPKGTEVQIQIGVTLDGTVNGASNSFHAPTPLFMAAYGAVHQWRFRPYLKDGKPDIFGANIIFRAQ
jgi:hypothetical protein